MRVVVLISCMLDTYTCCTYLCVQYYDSAESVKKRGRNHRSYQAIREDKVGQIYTLSTRCGVLSVLYCFLKTIKSQIFILFWDENILSFFFHVEQ